MQKSLEYSALIDDNKTLQSLIWLTSAQDEPLGNLSFLLCRRVYQKIELHM